MMRQISKVEQNRMMDDNLMFWILKKFGSKRGYILTPEEWKYFIRYTDKTMTKKFKKWQKDSKQVGGDKELRT